MIRNLTLALSAILLGLTVTGCSQLPERPPRLVSEQNSSRMTPSVSNVTSPGFEPVHLRAPGENAKVGNGARFKVRDGCVTLTADHVVERTNNPIITPLKSASSDAVVEASDKSLDLALIKQQHEKRDECAALPSVRTISDKILSATQREVWHVDSAGNGAPFNVDLTSVSADTIKLALVPGPGAPDAFLPGMSGSVVVFDGVPVAILNSVETQVGGQATAARLDAATRRFQKNLPQPTRAKPKKIAKNEKTFDPFDELQLPPFYRNIVKEARTIKARVERLVQEAEKVKRKANDAVSIAKQYPRGSRATNGYAHFTASNGNDYAGEARQIGITTKSRGYGVSIAGNEKNFGDTYYCRFLEDSGCSGPGVIEFATNDGNLNDLEVWKGEMSRGNRAGYGYLRWVKKSQGDYTNEAWYFHTNGANGQEMPGVWISSNGKRFEGGIGTNWNGWGVLWNSDGSVRAIGRWADGQFVEDQTAAWRADELEN